VPGYEPLYALLREIATDSERAVAEEEVDRIVEHLADAGFQTRPVRVRPDLRGVVYHGRKVLSKDDALFSHLVQRVVRDRQWAAGTSGDEYLQDLHAAVRHPSARVGVGAPEGSEPLVYIVSENTVPEQRRGENEEALMFVLFGTGPAAIITGHQASSVDEIDLPENVRWLR
jgi:hypothetical protein